MDGFLQREREELKTRWTCVVVLLTCLAMVLVVTQQGGTIDTQKNLIRALWDDSKALNKIRLQDLAKQREKMYLSDPQYAPPQEKDKDKEKDKEKAPPEKAAPEPQRPPVQSVLPAKPARVLRQI